MPTGCAHLEPPPPCTRSLARVPRSTLECVNIAAPLRSGSQTCSRAALRRPQGTRVRARPWARRAPRRTVGSATGTPRGSARRRARSALLAARVPVGTESSLDGGGVVESGMIVHGAACGVACGVRAVCCGLWCTNLVHDLVGTPTVRTRGWYYVYMYTLNSYRISPRRPHRPARRCGSCRWPTALRGRTTSARCEPSRES